MTSIVPGQQVYVFITVTSKFAVTPANPDGNMDDDPMQLVVTDPNGVQEIVTPVKINTGLYRALVSLVLGGASYTMVSEGAVGRGLLTVPVGRAPA